MKETEILIIGGGLAGLSAATRLAQAGHSVRVIERHPYPRHKVCGEYLSLEVMPLLERFGVYLGDGPRISRFLCSGPSGKIVETSLPLGAVGISRYALDMRMAEAAQAAGAVLTYDHALSISQVKGITRVTGKKADYQGKLLLAAWGKRSALDRTTGRHFWDRKSRWMALKMHYGAVDFPGDAVGLYFFKGGYAGCSLTETGDLNFCCLFTKERLTSLGGHSGPLQALIAGHPRLREWLDGAVPRFEKPLSIAEVDFGKKALSGKDRLYCGDAAHLIHPLCGNGMAMAIHSGEMAGRLTSQYLKGEIPDPDDWRNRFTSEWRKMFSSRLRWGRFLQGILTHPAGVHWAIHPLILPSPVLKGVIKRTHGKPLIV